MSVERNLVVRVATALILGPIVLWLLWIATDQARRRAVCAAL